MPASHSTDSITHLSIDYEKGTIEIEYRDRPAMRRASNVIQRSDEFLRGRFDLERRELALDVDEVTSIVADVGPSPSPVALERPVMYLDQNHWITLARQLYSPEKVASSEREAAELVVCLARERRIVLPLAGAHFAETSRTDGKRRRDLARTMLELSRGWQMRHPASIRRLEVRDALARSQSVPVLTDWQDQLFTLDPRRLLATEHDSDSSSQLGPEGQDLADRLGWVTALYGLLLKDEADPDLTGKEIAREWIERLRVLAVYMHEHRIKGDGVRIAATGWLLDLITPDLAVAAASLKLTTAQFEQWLHDDADQSVGSMPHLGRLYEIVTERLRNSDGRWESNDLNDLMYLSAAAGYADVVVGEKKTAGQLVRIPANTSGARVYRRLADALPYLDSLRSR